MKTQIFKNIPNCFRKYRLIRGLKQKDVAVVLGHKNTSTISRWENGDVLPNTLSMVRLSILYRTLTDGLLNDLKKRMMKEIQDNEKKLLNKKDD